MSVGPLKVIIEGSYCLNHLASLTVVRGHFPSIDGSDSVDYTRRQCLPSSVV